MEVLLLSVDLFLKLSEIIYNITPLLALVVSARYASRRAGR
jgi:hypothetical protein